MRIWFGEDLNNWNEDDNNGRVCTDVHANILGTYAPHLFRWVFFSLGY